MELLVTSTGQARCIYGEELDLSCLGPCSIVRASHVEPDQHGHWFADLSPVRGPTLGPYRHRSDALQAEHDWLLSCWLR